MTFPVRAFITGGQGCSSCLSVGRNSAFVACPTPKRHIISSCCCHNHDTMHETRSRNRTSRRHTPQLRTPKLQSTTTPPPTDGWVMHRRCVCPDTSWYEAILIDVHCRHADYANSFKAVSTAVRRAFPFVIVRGNALPPGEQPRL